MPTKSRRDFIAKKCRAEFEKHAHVKDPGQVAELIRYGHVMCDEIHEHVREAIT